MRAGADVGNLVAQTLEVGGDGHGFSLRGIRD
jgi:hypothetical protein